MKFWELTIFTLLTMIFGILGFYISIHILTPTGESPTFFDIKFNNEKKNKVEKLLKNRIQKIGTLIPIIKSQLESLQPAEKQKSGTNGSTTTSRGSEEDELKRQILDAQSDSPEDKNKIKRDDLNRKLEIAETTLSQSIKELNELLYYNKDTSLNYYADYIWIDRKQMFDSLSNDSLNTKAKVASLKFYLVDTSLASIDDNPTVIKDSINAEMNDPKSKVSFINQYPVFGFWLVFSIGQMTIWFIIAIIVIGVTIKTIMRINENKI